MFADRTAACVLAVACVLTTLGPLRTIKPHPWRSFDIQIGSLRVQAKNSAASVCYEAMASAQNDCALATRIPLLHTRQKDAPKIKICIEGRRCLTAWSDGTSHVWLISGDRI